MPSAPLRAVSSANATTTTSQPAEHIKALVSTGMYLQVFDLSYYSGDFEYSTFSDCSFFLQEGLDEAGLFVGSSEAVFSGQCTLTTPPMYVDTSGGSLITRLYWQSPQIDAPTFVWGFFLHGFSMGTSDPPGSYCFANHPTTGIAPTGNGFGGGGTLMDSGWVPDGTIGGIPATVGTDMTLTSAGIQINNSGYYSFKCVGTFSMFFDTPATDYLLAFDTFS